MNTSSANGGESLHATRRHLKWLTAGGVLAFAVPFVFADVLSMQRDLYYGLYLIGVLGLFVAWAHFAGGGVMSALARRWRWGVGLGLAFAGATALIAVRAESATGHPHGIRFVAALAWRGIAYGFADGLLLTSFPVLTVFAAFAGRKVLQSRRGKLAVGVLALAASLAFTAVYHAGYPDFRGDKLAQPIRGDVVWSIPTLVTLNPVGAPIAHVGLHVGAVVHSYDTDLFLPPHREARR
jgi:hypothetical protein